MFDNGAAICGQLKKARADTSPTESKLNIIGFNIFFSWIDFKKHTLYE